jgi:hypothetical protein
VTYDQVAARKEKAANFARNVLQDDDLADSLEGEDVESYAERKKLVIKNAAKQSPKGPQLGTIRTQTRNRRTNKAMANNGNDDLTKADLQDMVDQAYSILSDAYDPQSSREDMAGAIADALDVLEGNGDDGDDDDGDDDDQYVDDDDTYTTAG